MTHQLEGLGGRDFRIVPYVKTSAGHRSIPLPALMVRLLERERDTMAILGHASSAMTAEVYQHVLPDALRAAAAQVDAAIAAPV